jgi:hypothetical protein
MNRRAPSLLLALGLAGLAGALGAAEQNGFLISVRVDGAPAEEYAARDRIYIEASKGREFVVRLSNPGPERVAVALSVDGRTVIDARRTGSLEAAKWILAPGQTIDVPGWQISGASARKFFFTETSKSYAKWLGDTANVGTIEAVFYREKRRPPIAWRKDADARDEAGREAGASGSQGSRAPAAPSAQSKARSAENFAATGIGEKTDFPVEWVAFEEEKAPAARIALRYEFRTELGRLGVLPRGEDLYARDRAHGFEHDYAPDPYRR